MEPVPYPPNGFPSAKSLADLLGLTDDPPPPAVTPQLETWRHEEMVHKVLPVFQPRAGARGLDALSREFRSGREAVDSEFAAKYLPKLVDHFLDVPAMLLVRVLPDTRDVRRIHNSYTLMLNELRDNRYFVRFLMSTDPSAARGNEVARCLAERIALHLPIYRDELALLSRTEQLRRMQGMGNILKLLYTILAHQVDKSSAVPIPGPVASQLFSFCGYCINIAAPEKENYLFVKSMDQLGSFLKTNRHPTALRRIRDDRDFWQGLQKCANPGCRATLEEDDMWQCGRCKTVLYCGPMHQREHWHDPVNPHKNKCYKTTY